MEETAARDDQQQGVTGDEMPGGGPEGGDAGEPRAPDRIVTSSGEAPTGGTPVGGAADRSIPSKHVREHSSRTNTQSRDDEV
jgi:hypothetical protein